MRIVCALVLLALTASAQADISVRDVRWEQRLGAQLPLDLRFRDEAARPVELQQFFGHMPVVLVFVYFSCPELCPEVLSGVREALPTQKPGSEYAVLAVSIDPRDTPAQAATQKAHLFQANLASATHFLTSADNSAQRLADAAGFHYAYDAEHGQFAHPAGFLIVDPEGNISRYFFGVRFDRAEVRSAIDDAARSRIGQWAQQILLRCYHFDPTQGRYSALVMNALRGFSALLLMSILAVWLIHNRHKRG